MASLRQAYIGRTPVLAYFIFDRPLSGSGQTLPMVLARTYTCYVAQPQYSAYDFEGTTHKIVYSTLPSTAPTWQYTLPGHSTQHTIFNVLLTKSYTAHTGTTPSTYAYWTWYYLYTGLQQIFKGILFEKYPPANHTPKLDLRSPTLGLIYHTIC